jgi:mannose-6-phosphate isomerase-like protein (cupin superfamily)
VPAPAARPLRDLADEARSPIDARWLRQLVERIADEVRAGGVSPTATPSQRRADLIAVDDAYEAWVIRWPAGGAIDLHDHGGSAGAFTVIEGTLTELRADRARRRAPWSRDVQTGASAVFGPHHVHDVVNAGDEPAVSVHVYAPPLVAMTFYEVAGDAVRPVRTEAVPPAGA